MAGANEWMKWDVIQRRKLDQIERSIVPNDIGTKLRFWWWIEFILATTPECLIGVSSGVMSIVRKKRSICQLMTFWLSGEESGVIAKSCPRVIMTVHQLKFLSCRFCERVTVSDGKLFDFHYHHDHHLHPFFAKNLNFSFNIRANILIEKIRTISGWANFALNANKKSIKIM